jgi:hypothetical protein
MVESNSNTSLDPVKVIESSSCDDTHRGRSEVILSRAGMNWYIEIDTCFGHSSCRLDVVSGACQMEPAVENESKLMEEQKSAQSSLTTSARALFLSIAQRTRLMKVTSQIFSSRQSETTPKKNIRPRVTIVKLLEGESGGDPALNIPMFCPLHDGPHPVIEIDEEEANEKMTARRSRRSSVFDVQSQSELNSRISGIDVKALLSFAEDCNEDQEDEELLEGFGNPTERKTVQVRRFIRRNKFLKKVFGGKKVNSKADEPFDIDISERQL